MISFIALSRSEQNPQQVFGSCHQSISRYDSSTSNDLSLQIF